LRSDTNSGGSSAVLQATWSCTREISRSSCFSGIRQTDLQFAFITGGAPTREQTRPLEPAQQRRERSRIEREAAPDLPDREAVAFPEHEQHEILDVGYTSRHLTAARGAYDLGRGPAKLQRVQGRFFDMRSSSAGTAADVTPGLVRTARSGRRNQGAVFRRIDRHGNIGSHP
jgi:hypothetical protein